MSRIIDRVAFWIAVSAGAFVYFLWASRSIPAATIMTLILMVCARQLTQKLFARTEARRARHRYATRRIREWMLSDGAQATMEAARLTCRVYHLPEPEPSEGAATCQTGAQTIRFELDQRPPAGRPLDASDVMARYRQNRGMDALVIMVTADANPKAAAFAREMRAPRVRIVDAAQLADWVSQEVKDPLPEPQERKNNRAKAAIRTLLDRVRPWRCLRYGVLLLIMYLVLGSFAYLPASMTLILLAGLKMRRPRISKSLLDPP